MLKDFEPRLYQQTIFSSAAEKNCLVVLPTGMGKTAVAMMLAAHRLKQFPQSKILILSPTRPLINQHLLTFKKYLDMDESCFTVFTGQVSPEKRAELWQDKRIIFSTPQGLENDVISSRIKLEDVSLLVVDESHRAVGDYAYVFIAKQYEKKAKFPRILALTASPGSDLEKISEVCNNLHIEDVEVRTPESPDVKPYIQDVKNEFVKVKLPDEFKVIKKFLETCYKNKLSQIKKYGMSKSIALVGKKDLLALSASLHGRIARGEKDFSVLKSISLAAEALKVSHALELLESQGISALYSYMTRLFNDSATSKVKAVKNLVADSDFKSAFVKVEVLHERKVEHPKVEALKDIVVKEIENNKDVKIMIFTQFRDSAVMIKDKLDKFDIESVVFVGQTKKGSTGMNQKTQIATLKEFGENAFNVLIATSVGEEGLDIPSVDLVVFYEPVPSGIRTIQRRGRTGRLESGKVITLITEGTRDEAYRWSAHHKEKRMFNVLDKLKKKLALKSAVSQPGLRAYLEEENKFKIFVDPREKGGGVVKELADLDIKVSMERLDVGDYVLSERCGVEFKTVKDFVDSIVDGRLLAQIRELKKSFTKPVILIEGDEDIYSQRRVHPNAIRGMLATIAVSYGIPMVYSKNPKDSAAILFAIARREQEELTNDFNPHSSLKPLTGKELQEYIVGSFPGVGPNLAKDLLAEFGSIKNVINASEDDLKKVPKVGDAIAKRLRNIFDREYFD